MKIFSIPFFVSWSNEQLCITKRYARTLMLGKWFINCLLPRFIVLYPMIICSISTNMFTARICYQCFYSWTLLDKYFFSLVFTSFLCQISFVFDLNLTWSEAKRRPKKEHIYLENICSLWSLRCTDYSVPEKLTSPESSTH